MMKSRSVKISFYCSMRIRIRIITILRIRFRIESRIIWIFNDSIFLNVGVRKK